MSQIFIDGVSIAGYRSIGEQIRLGPLGQINLLIGPNNCGKSNILRFIYRALPERLAHSPRHEELKCEDQDRHQGEYPFAYGLATGPRSRILCDLKERLPRFAEQLDEVHRFLRELSKDSLAWYECVLRDNNTIDIP